MTPKLHEIEIPALLTCGRYDDAKPKTVYSQSQLIKGAKFHVFEHSSHTTYVEEEMEYLRVVREFLHSVEK